MNLTGPFRQKQENNYNSIDIKELMSRSTGMGGIGSGRRTPTSKTTKKSSSTKPIKPQRSRLQEHQQSGAIGNTKDVTTNVGSIMTFTSKLSSLGPLRDPKRTKPEGSNVITPQKTALPPDQNDIMTTELSGLTKGGTMMNVVTPPKKTTAPEHSEITKMAIPGLMQGGTSMNPPPEVLIVPQKKKDSPIEIAATTYKTKVLYKNKVMTEEIDVVVKLKALMARFFQYDKSVQLLPYDPTNKANPISNTKDSPTNEQDFEIYVPQAALKPYSKILIMHFRISSDRPLWQLKQISQIKNFLHKHSIFLERTYLSTTDNVKIGSLVLSHCQYTRRDAAIKDLNERINNHETLKTPIQLTPYTIWNGNGNKKISTRVLAVECSREHAQDAKARMFTKLINLPENMKYSNTRYFKFLPFSQTGAISETVIRSGIFLQNKFLLQCTAITMTRVHSVDWIVPNCSGATFKQLVLEAKGPIEMDNLFTSVEMGTSENKVHLITTKNLLTEAINWADNFTEQMKIASDSEEWWKNTTGSNGPPIRVDREVTTDAHQAYANYLTQTFSQYVGKEDEESGPTEAPSARRSWSRVVYGSSKPSRYSKATGDTEMSSMTSPESTKATVKIAVESAIEGVKRTSEASTTRVKNTLIVEMRKLNQDSAEQMSRMERQSGVYDDMFSEVLANNKAKADEMLHYEQRLHRINDNTQQTAEMSAQTAQATVATMAKVDRLSNTMKQFMGVMVNALGHQGVMMTGDDANQTNLQNLVNSLDEEVTAKMDVDEIYNNNHLTQEPSPGTIDALGGEGDKK